MKKNTMMRLAAILLVGVLLTTSVIGGTFAKYVTTDNGSDNARVAKWGINVDVATGTAFATSYDATANVTDKEGAVIAKTVVSSTTDKLVAPGTNGTLATIDISGKAEVALEVKAQVDLELTGWEIDSNTYFPIIIKVNGVAVTYAAGASMEDIEAEVEKAIITAINDATSYDADGTGKKATTNYGANHPFGAAGSPADVTVTWEWPFEGDDVKDTALGDQAAEGSAATIAITYKVTVTQID